MAFRILASLLLLFALDLYVFQAFKIGFRNTDPTTQRTIQIVFWTLSGLVSAVLICSLFYDFKLWPKALRTYAGAGIFILTFSKLFVLLFLVTDDAFRGFRWVYARLFPTAPSPDLAITPSGGITRSEFLVKTGLVLGSLPFVSLIYGMVKGAYDVQVRNIRIRLSNIPVSFNGFRIVQISDWHVGSFVSKTPLEEAVKRINALKPDLILFTGDLVNNTSDELEPYTAILSELKASHGIFSVLGNHDYGDYVRWESQEDKQRNLQRLVDLQRSMGWDLLLDEHRHIEKEGEKITVIGVQNYSVHMRFPKYGSLPKATTGIDYSPFNILLSHDPSHWKSEVITSFPDVHLTLSGHTHGFQFGVELPQFKWSPVQYVYKEWAGLYSKEQQHLYVNRGLGFLGYPGRVGIRPEITVFELERT